MLPILQRRFRALENSKESMLAQVGALPREELNQRPAPDKWSVAELLQHLALVERGILQTVKRRLEEERRERVKVGDRVGSLIVRNVLRSPLRMRVPDEVAEAITPASEVTAEAALAEWNSVRKEWCDLLASAHASDVKGGVFNHPKGGRFTLPETVLFLRLHHDHHRAQLARIAKAVRGRVQAVSV